MLGNSCEGANTCCRMLYEVLEVICEVCFDVWVMNSHYIIPDVVFYTPLTFPLRQCLMTYLKQA